MERLGNCVKPSAYDWGISGQHSQNSMVPKYVIQVNSPDVQFYLAFSNMFFLFSMLIFNVTLDVFPISNIVPLCLSCFLDISRKDFLDISRKDYPYLWILDSLSIKLTFRFKKCLNGNTKLWKPTWYKVRINIGVNCS